MPLCMGCLNELNGTTALCENCGFDNSVEQSSPFLPYGTVLNGRYVVAKDLNTNGESTRYLGYDKTSGKVLTIREFLPIGLFNRGQGDKIVNIAPDHVTEYSVAVSDFENYYNKIKSLADLSAMVVIDEVFRENNTCYVIEESDDSIPFVEYVKNNGGQLDWEDARPMFMPIISLLEAMHKVGIGHYAVSPSNLYVNADGKLILSGFSTENERKRGTMLKSQLFSGCAAPEQYRNDNVLDISTDIYGFTEGSPAEKSGLLTGDTILAVNGIEVKNITIKYALFPQKSGTLPVPSMQLNAYYFDKNKQRPVTNLFNAFFDDNFLNNFGFNTNATKINLVTEPKSLEVQPIPSINNGNWWLWDAETGEYVDSGRPWTGSADGSVPGVGLPYVSAEDDGKVAMVVDGSWQAAELPLFDGTYTVTPSAEGEVVLAAAQKLMDANVVVEKIPFVEVTNSANGKTATIG